MSRITVALHQQCRDKTCTWLFGGAKLCLLPGTPDRIGHEHRAPRHPGADSQRPPDRELIWQDPHRPRYHLTPPEGFFNDPNGVQRAGERYVTIVVARRVLVRRVVRQQQRDVEAAGLLRAHLPEAVNSELLWSSLKRQDVSFIDDRLRDSESDLLYAVQRKANAAPAWLYVLLEHQSTPAAILGE